MKLCKFNEKKSLSRNRDRNDNRVKLNEFEQSSKTTSMNLRRNRLHQEISLKESRNREKKEWGETKQKKTN